MAKTKMSLDELDSSLDSSLERNLAAFNQGIAGPSGAAPVSAFERPAEVAMMEAHVRAQIGGEYAAPIKRESDQQKVRLREEYDTELARREQQREVELQEMYDRELAEATERQLLVNRRAMESQYKKDLQRDVDGERRKLESWLQKDLQQNVAEERRKVEERYGKQVAQAQADMELAYQRDLQRDRDRIQEELRAQMEHEWANREKDNEQVDEQIDNAWDQARAWYQQEIQASKDVIQQLQQAMSAHVPPVPAPPSGGYVHYSGPPAGGPGGAYPPGGPPDGSGPGAFRRDQQRDAHKVDVPSLGSSSALTMPTARDYIVWKEKVSLYLDITGYEQTVVLGKLLLKMQGRVAEFVLLTFTGDKRRQPNCVHELCACLDSVILGDLTLMVQKGV
jgi:hypothetical protein